MSSGIDRPKGGVRPDRGGHLLAERGELRVEVAGHDECGTADRGELIPERSLRAETGETQAAGEAFDSVHRSVVETLGVVRQRREQGRRQPSLEERGDALGLELRGESVVVGATLIALRL